MIFAYNTHETAVLSISYPLYVSAVSPPLSSHQTTNDHMYTSNPHEGTVVLL